MQVVSGKCRFVFNKWQQEKCLFSPERSVGIALGQAGVGVLLEHFLCRGRSTERTPEFPHQGSSSEVFSP